jgi:YQGE family putative transporter
MIVVLYLISGGLSFLLPSDSEPQPFRLKRALFAGKGLRDWRYVMLASASLAGSYHIFAILLGLLMYMETLDEAVVGGYASYQAVVVIIVSYLAGRIMTPETRKRYLFIGAASLALSGFLFCLPISAGSLVAFGFMRSLSLSLFSIAHFSLRMDIISDSVLDNGERIEFLTAWEIPLAFGRITMLGCLLILSNVLSENGLGIRISLFFLCAIRLVTYWLLSQTSQIREPA